MKIRILAGIFSSLFLASCGSSKVIQTLKPEADLAAPIVYSKEVSYLSVPLSINLKDIEFQTNSVLKGLIYEDSVLEDDDYVMKIWKQAPIEISNDKGEIKVVLPLKIWAKIRYGGSVLGIDMYDTREFNLNGIAVLKGVARFNNWQLSANSRVESVEWKESPSITIAGKKVPITYVINPAMKLFKSTIEKKLDAVIFDTMNFKEYLLTTIEQLSAPVLVNEAFDTWFTIKPLHINSTEAVLKNNFVTMNVAMGCYMETFLGKPIQPPFTKESIKLNLVDKTKEEFSASLIVVSPYLNASDIITRNFQNKEFSSGSKKVLVQQVDLWHKNGKIIIALSLKGSVNGTIYLTGIPKYNSEEQTIFFDDLGYVLETQNALIKTANWLLKGVVLNKMKEYTSYSIKNDLELAKIEMQKYLNNYSPSKGVLLNGSMSGLAITGIQLSDQALVATIKATGKLAVSINGMN